MPYKKYFHINEMCCSQHKLLNEKNCVGLPFKIFYLFTGNSDKMLFQVM